MAEPRKYALTRIATGDYLCPSNDQRFLWRFTRYDEDGSLSRYDGQVISGSFWSAHRRPMPNLDMSPERIEEMLDDWGNWEFWSDLHPTRKAAIGAMLKEMQ